MFKTRLDTFENTFGHFWNFENIFCENFRKLDPPRNTGQKNFREVCPKTGSKHVWILLGTILGIFGILKKQLENFRKLDPPWNTGHKIFQKVCPKTCSKHVWRLLGTLLGIFGILKFFFLLKIFENSTLQGTLGKKIFRKIFPKTCSKHVWILLRTLLGIFGILKRYFFENFRKLDPPRNTGQKNFRKN